MNLLLYVRVISYSNKFKEVKKEDLKDIYSSGFFLK